MADLACYQKLDGVQVLSLARMCPFVYCVNYNSLTGKHDGIYTGDCNYQEKNHTNKYKALFVKLELNHTNKYKAVCKVGIEK